MTTIREHIEAGRYKRDDKGRALVPVVGNLVATICATDAPGDRPIIGFIRGPHNATHLDSCPLIAWHEDGVHARPAGAWTDLLPPPPRKVKVEVLAVVIAGTGTVVSVREPDAPPAGVAGFERLVRLTGEYEEPWE